MKVLICGGRDYTNASEFVEVLEYIQEVKGRVTAVVEGDARGADFLAKQYAKEGNLKLYTHPADWKENRFSAGPIRNTEMLDKHPDLAHVIAFPGGSGTADMCKKAKARGISLIYGENVANLLRSRGMIS